MSFDFPNSPTEGQAYVPIVGAKYVFTGGKWAGAVGAAGVAAVTVSDTAPSSPSIGSLWFESDTGNTFLWYTDADSSQWVQINVLAGIQQSAATIPAGSIMDFAGTSAPPGWMMCFGQAVSRSVYAALFTAIGTAYGAGDGSNTFNLPDCRGRVTAGKDDMGGTSANRITQFDGDTLGMTGGLETHTLTLAQMASHNHAGATGTFSADHSHYISGSTGLVSADHSHSTNALAATAGGARASLAGGTNYPNPVQSGGISANHYHDIGFSSGTSSANHTHSVSAAGGDGAHNNMQPTIVFNKMIKI